MSKGKHKRKKQQAEQRAQQQAKEAALPTDRTNESINDKEPRENFVGWIREKSSFSDWCLVVFTGVLAAASIYQFIIMRGQLNEMQRQTEISERPWLSVEPKPILLNWVDYPTGKQAVLVLRLPVKNVGKSIAKDIQIDAKIFPTKVEMPVAPDAMKHQQELCDHPTPAPIGKFDLFPGDPPAKREIDISAGPTAIEAQTASSTGDKPRKLVGFYVIGCVSYHFSFGTQMHQTFFAYHLLGPMTTTDREPLVLSNGMPVIMGGFEIGVEVKEDQFGVMQELLARNDAY